MFHHPLKRKPVNVFQGTTQKVKVEMNGKTKILEVNWNFLSFLLALSAKSAKSIDYQKALQYALCAVPLTLLPTGGGFLSHTTIVLAATLKPLKLWLPNFVTSCFYFFATI